MSDYGYCCPTGYSIFDEKDPESTLDYLFNWKAELQDDIIDTSTFLLPDGMTEVSSSNTDNTATIFVSGGSSCGVYRITNRITTLGGRSFDQTIFIRIKDQ